MRFAQLSTLGLALLSATWMGGGAFAQSLSARATTLPFDLARNAVAATSFTSGARSRDTSLVSSSDATALPDSPSFLLAGDSSAADQSGNGAIGSTTGNIAPRYATAILPGQAAQPLSGGQKVAFAFRDVTSPFNFLSIVISATYSQGVDSAPHYGQGWGPYGQRIGASAARNTVQTLASEAVFAPLFHDDPRYYVLGRQHKFFNRVVYAATRVAVTRSDSGHNRLNAPLLLGYGIAAGVNNATVAAKTQRRAMGRHSAVLCSVWK